MAYLKHQVIVLRRKTLRRGDRWYSLLTQDNQKIDALARSAARSNSKLAGHLEPGMKAEVMLAPGKSIIHIAGSHTICSYRSINTSFELLILKWSALEAIYALTYGHEKTAHLFDNLDYFLNCLATPDLKMHTKQTLLDMLIADGLSRSGLKPNLQHNNFTYFDFGEDSLVEQSHNYGMQLNAQVLKMLRLYFNESMNFQDKHTWLNKIKLDTQILRRIHNFIYAYADYQLGSFNIRPDKFFLRQRTN